jgi:hypothetical protein
METHVGHGVVEDEAGSARAAGTGGRSEERDGHALTAAAAEAVHDGARGAGLAKKSEHLRSEHQVPLMP